MRVSTWHLSVCIASFVVTGVLPLSGQVQTSACGASDGQTVNGVVLDDGTDVGISGAWVYLYEGCRTTTDSAGRFVFRGVSGGSVRLDVGARGYREFRPQSYPLPASDAQGLVVRLVPGGPLEDCRLIPECAPLVAPPASMPSELGFRTVAYGTTLALAWELLEGGAWYACVGDEPEDLLDALAEQYDRVTAGDTCEMMSEPSGRPRRRVRHRPTGAPAIILRLEAVEVSSPTRREVSLAYIVAPLYAAGWKCVFEEADGEWHPTLCWQEWES